MGKTVTICFTNNKGGSGKSTTCSNLGAAMARAGKKVLMVYSRYNQSDLPVSQSHDKVSSLPDEFD